MIKRANTKTLGFYVQKTTKLGFSEQPNIQIVKEQVSKGHNALYKKSGNSSPSTRGQANSLSEASAGR